MPAKRTKGEVQTAELVGLVSHKFKTPLTTIRLYSEAMINGQVGKVSKEQKEYLREIHKAAKKMVSFINEYVRQTKKNKEK